MTGTSEARTARVPRWRRLAVEWVLWLVALLAAYLVLISTVTRVEVAVGVGVAALGSAVGVAATAPFRPAPPPRRLAWRRLWWFPVDVLRDVVGLVGVAGRWFSSGARHLGEFDEVVLSEYDDNEADSVRAYGVLLLSSSPACYVVDVHVHDDAPDRLLLHRLGTPSRFEQAVER